MPQSLNEKRRDSRRAARTSYPATFTLTVESEGGRIMEVRRTPLDKLEEVLQRLNEKMR